MSLLFSEVYGCYYGIVARILARAANGVSQKEMNEIIEQRGFSETAFHLLPLLTGSGNGFLEKRGDLYYAKLSGSFPRPVTGLELSWLAAILSDPRIGLFVADERLADLRAELSDVTPAFKTADFVAADQHADGDPYGDPVYIRNFRTILAACKESRPVLLTYDSEKTGRSQRVCHPYQLSYSELNDKFRLLCAVFNAKKQRLDKRIFNLARVDSVEPSDTPFRVSADDLCRLFAVPDENPPLTVEITSERNSLERFLLQFASFDRKTEYDPARNIYTCHVSYDPADETELLIRILSFGPTVKVLSPPAFLTQVRERVARQIALMRKNGTS